mgnify:CR=1 FL=1|tara:strand:+ start:116 stop:232 length:117 start_codon:yes stop_codon:yes gene_type:complete
MFKKLKELILSPWRHYKERQKIKRKLAKIKEDDPFIYE